ncbi:hypothetical protein PF005_g23111 [Phytophthora fragariae]|uniref:Uncharacterized protein n=1 Tax=Phytophthora fragariae TaxID=53985 RepID=A0A6A3QVL0_9STRA|nr:hypothetical protein PF003_g12574 [Phytophthora fragariae]KAE8909006.1 hypothetical protein PF003_g6893 [Phytophthora fragariae]KAE8909131.1 hypothetical protein PF003_g6930 [Phytophthora fragariae]KAE8909133.1 hypothetical protein PF003_g6932 [Phytophthora fragariae]KAE8916940.1 hypothetical protein PF009_g32738 [Phytophthora fragariae]
MVKVLPGDPMSRHLVTFAAAVLVTAEVSNEM